MSTRLVIYTLVLAPQFAPQSCSVRGHIPARHVTLGSHAPLDICIRPGGILASRNRINQHSYQDVVIRH
jgi:hypothetical protein